MGTRRFLAVPAGLLIITLLITGTPVYAAEGFPDSTALIMEHVNVTDPANATLVLRMLQSLERPRSHSPAMAGSAPAAMSAFSMAAAGPGISDAIGPGDSLQMAINNAPAGSTIYLDPGIYHVHDITIEKNIRIQTNTTTGGTRYNTVLDAELQGRIFNVTGPYALIIDNITVQNGALVLANSSVPSTGNTAVSGGGILAAPGSTLSITSAIFRNCTVTGSDYYTAYNYAKGGAIASNGTVAVTSSSFEDCSARTIGVIEGFARGGAIFTQDGAVTIASSAFSRCSVLGDSVLVATEGGRGGAVYSLNSPTTITASTFTDCSAALNPIGGGSAWGGAICCDGTGASITDSVFTGCTAKSDNPAAAIGLGVGGAVISGDGTAITNTTFTGCSATGNGTAVGQGIGGAIYSGDGTTIARSTFTGCTASGTGQTSGQAIAGAVNARDGTVITGSTFRGCTATVEGLSLGFGGAGAVSSGGGTAITDSAFTSCTATISGQGTIMGSAGAAALGEGSTVTRSTFTGCSVSASGTGQIMAIGGAVTSGGGSAITDSVFTGCSLHGSGQVIPYLLGGTILMYEGSSLSRTTFAGCSVTATATQDATANGGAVSIVPGTEAVSITDSTFSGCSVSASAPVTEIAGGGAIGVFSAGTPVTSPITVTSSTITGCSAKSGGAISIENGTPALHFNRLYQNTASDTGTAVNATVGVDATDNWWGSNSDPAPQVWGPVTTDPWLVLGITSTPSSINDAQIPAIRANLIYDSAGASTAGGGIFVPANIMSSFAVVTGYGSVSPPAAGTANGIAGTWFRPAGTGATNISATIDDQTVYLNLTVLPAPASAPVVTLDTSGNDDGFPSAAVTPATAQTDTIPLMTVTVNIGGDSKAWQAVVTGTRLSDLIVTGTVQHGPSGSCNPPAGSVFQYLSLEPARYGTITNAVINFTIPQSWLDENTIDPKSIVLYHMTPDCWQPLPTTFLSPKDGRVYYSAVSPGFSQFAIAGTPATAAQVASGTPPLFIKDVVQTPAATAVVKDPITTQTTAPPAAIPQPAAPSPLLNIVLVIAAIGILASGGFMARRWWIQRQNPALFREYD